MAEAYHVNPLEGVLSHEIKKYLIDSNACIANKDVFDQKVDEHDFQINQAFALDVIFSTGEGKAKESELRCTVYKRCLERQYTLKTKQGRAFFAEMDMHFPALPFTMRAF